MGKGQGLEVRVSQVEDLRTLNATYPSLHWRRSEAAEERRRGIMTEVAFAIADNDDDDEDDE